MVEERGGVVTLTIGHVGFSVARKDLLRALKGRWWGGIVLQGADSGEHGSEEERKNNGGDERVGEVGHGLAAVDDACTRKNVVRR